MQASRKTAIAAILITVAMLLSSQPADAAAPFSDLEAQAALLAEVDTGTVLFERNMNVRHPADSLAKVMTMILALTAIENGDASIYDFVVMTESAMFDITSRSTTQGISVGEEMPLLDLMYCAFIGSANEACNLIAEYIAGDVGAFVDMMNDRAEDLGCEGTNFTNPHGQYSDDQYTTAMDQYRIFREAISYQLFLEISGVFRHTIEGTNKAEQRRLVGTNSLVNSSGKYHYRPCNSGLASATYEGGYSYVGFAESDGMSLIVVVLGSDVIMFEDESAEMRNLTEARRLFEWGFSEFGWRVILVAGELVGKAPIIHGAGADFVNLRAETEIKELLDNDIPDSAFVRNVTIYSVDSEEPLYAPVLAGEVLGEVTITRGGVDYGTVLLTANTTVELNRLQFIRMQVMELANSSTARTVIWVLVILVVLYTALVVRYNIVRIRRMRKIREAKRKLAEERQQPQKIDLDELPSGKGDMHFKR